MWKMVGEQEEEEGAEWRGGVRSGGVKQLVGSANHQGNTHLIDM